MNIQRVDFSKDLNEHSYDKTVYEKKQKKLKFISRITPSRMIFKRFDANVVGMIFRGRLAIGGGRW